jgi:hypothetical protein
MKENELRPSIRASELVSAFVTGEGIYQGSMREKRKVAEQPFTISKINLCIQATKKGVTA